MPDTTQINEEQAKLDDILKQQRDSLQSLNQLNIEKEGIQAGIDRLNTTLVDTQTQVDQMNAALDTASTSRAGVLTELADLKIQVSAAVADLAAYRTANEQAAIKSNAEFQALQKSQDAYVADAQAKVDALLAQKDEVDKQIAPLADQVSRLTNQVTLLQAQIVSLSNEVTVHTTSLHDLNFEISQTTGDIETLKTEITSLEKDITDKTLISSNLDTNIATKNTQIVDLNSQIATLEETLKEHNELNTEFLQARAGLKAGQEEVDQRLAFLKSKYEQLGEPW